MVLSHSITGTMAGPELLPYGEVASLGNKLKSSAWREIGEIYGITDKMQDLISNLEEIERLFLDADDNQEEDGIQVLIRNLKGAVQAADDFFDDIATQILRLKVIRFFYCTERIAFQLQVYHKSKKIQKKINDIRIGFDRFKLKPRSSESERRETTSFLLESEVILGRDEDIRVISKMLFPESLGNEKVSVIGIVGVGGIGKTAVAQLVYNSEQVSKFFDVKIWVYVSDDFVVETIIKHILESLHFESIDQEFPFKDLLNMLKRVLTDKRYLLVLDDVWNEDSKKWTQLMTQLICGAPGSKILVTTRSEIVADIIEVNTSFRLRGLSDDDSWILLKNFLFGNDDYHQMNHIILEQVGKKIATNCRGVPQLIRTVASMLHGKYEEHEWLEVLQGDFWKQGHVEHFLKSSYQHLSSELKQCFVHCLVYPKGWLIEKKEFIQLWMAQGYLEGLDDEREMEDVGYEFLSTLQKSSFFQPDEKLSDDNQDSFKVHDLMYDLALLVDGNNYSLGRERDNTPIHMCFSPEFNNTNLSGFPGAPGSLEKFLLQHIFFPRVSNNLNLLGSMLKDFLQHMCFPQDYARKLRTIFLQRANDREIAQMPREWPFILRLKRLRTLSMSHSSLMKLSYFIGELKHLRYLDLSWCVKLVSLPKSIANLVNLQTLKLTGCEKLQFSTKIVTKLISLRHLEIHRCKAFKDMMPAGLGKLSSLQSLSNFYVVNDKKKKAGKLNELQNLNSLRGNLEINRLDQVSNVKLDSQNVNLKQKYLLDSLDLNWENRNDIEESFQLLENLCPHQHLKRLHVKWYPGDRFSTWLSSIKYLSHISLFGFDNCKSLPPLENLENLKSLEISSMKVLDCIELGFHPAATIFQSLERLVFSGCQNFRGWKRMKDQVGVDNLLLPQFCRLSQLIINKCPKLADLPTFPNVEELQLCESMVKPLKETLDMASSSLSSTPLSMLKSLKIEGKLPNISLLPSQWKQNLISLEHLEIGDADKPDIWFKGNFPSLQKVVIYGCDLKALPSKICDVFSLQHIKMMGCHKLASLPKEMVKLTKLATIEIWDCPLLVERCQEETGADWPQVKHVKKIIFKENLRQ